MNQQPMVKTLALLVRKPDMTHDEFVRYWVDVHAPMARSISSIKRYVLSFVVFEPQRPPHQALGIAAGAVDGIAEIWFESQQSYMDFRESEMAKTWFADGARFIGQNKSFLCTEQVIIG